ITETALTRVVNDILISSDEGKSTVIMLLDLSAAFDTIDHSILLHRLDNDVGLTGTVLAWFSSYLSNRFQYVQKCADSTPSLYTEVQYGVPQGSVLGPLLFSLYMLPLGSLIRKHNVNFHSYADDTQLYLSFKSNEVSPMLSLISCVSELKEWMNKNYLSLNTDKTDELVVDFRRPRPLMDPVIIRGDCRTISFMLGRMPRGDWVVSWPGTPTDFFFFPSGLLEFFFFFLFFLSTLAIGPYSFLR
uniref:Reverse transcriptase domain-containing protein n=1 Tax=Erpetoichthys calabaricus TaxID=27687 RepID=A0A8C4SRD1_ERPCA